jgi:predicted PurR-regulated permease PerM
MSSIPVGPGALARQVLVVIALVALALFTWKIAPVVLLLFAGIVFATAIHAGSRPLVRYLRLPPTVAVGIVFILAIALFALGGWLFGRQVSQQTTDLVDAVTQAWGKARAYLESTSWGATVIESVQGTASEGNPMARVAKGTVTVFGAFTDLILVLFLSMYLAAEPRAYRDGFLMLIPPRHRDRVGAALDEAGIALRKWLVGQLGAMVMVAVLTGAGLWLVGVPLAIPLGILSGLLDFVPVVGPFIGAAPGLLIAFAQGPQVALYAAGVYVTVQFLEGHFVLPLAQKWAVSLPPALALLSIVGFGLLFGPMGVLFAIPLTVVSIVLVQELYVRRLGDADTPMVRKARASRARAANDSPRAASD